MDYQIYLSKEEIEKFELSKQTSVKGFCYEWEGEHVVHIHVSPLSHAFGIVSRCLITKNREVLSSDSGQDCRFVILIEDIVRVFETGSKQKNEIIPMFIPSLNDLYSRSKGLLEVGILSEKHVSIVGLGSFGSIIAIELAKAGVGEFSLFDFDRIELHNLGRHTCTIKDLGRLKTNAIEEAILGKNPYAIVHKFPIDILKKKSVFSEEVRKSDLVICATDNNASRLLISTILVEHETIGIFGRAITRAAGGDVFRYKPGGPCYACLLGSSFINPRDEEISSEEAGRRSGNIPAYASADDINAMVQVGLSVDIEPICNLMLKIALVELSRGATSGISSLEEDFQYNAYIWANRRDKNFAKWHPFYQAGPKNTILKWYGLTIPRDEHCSICSEDPELDLGSEYGIVNPSDFEGIDVNLD